MSFRPSPHAPPPQQHHHSNHHPQHQQLLVPTTHQEHSRQHPYPPPHQLNQSHTSPQSAYTQPAGRNSSSPVVINFQQSSSQQINPGSSVNVVQRQSSQQGQSSSSGPAVLHEPIQNPPHPNAVIHHSPVVVAQNGNRMVLNHPVHQSPQNIPPEVARQ